MSDPGKEPLAIAVGLPVAAQALQQLFADGNLAELVSLSLHPHDLPLSIDVSGLEVGAFTQTQSAVVHDGEQPPKASFPDRVQQGGHLFPADDVGQQLHAMELDVVPALPWPAQMISEEGAQCAQRLVDRRVLQLAISLQVNQEFEDSAFAQPADRFALVETPQPPHPVEIRLAGAGAEISKLDKGGEVLVPRLRDDAAINCCFLILFHGT